MPESAPQYKRDPLTNYPPLKRQRPYGRVAAYAFSRSWRD
jgi:hypothetical protein